MLTESVSSAVSAQTPADSADTPRNPAYSTRGRPSPRGNPGRPKGSRNKVTAMAEAILAENAEALLRKAVELAVNGNVTARACVSIASCRRAVSRPSMRRYPSSRRATTPMRPPCRSPTWSPPAICRRAKGRVWCACSNANPCRSRHRSMLRRVKSGASAPSSN